MIFETKRIKIRVYFIIIKIIKNNYLFEIVCVTFGVVDRIIIFKEAYSILYTTEILESNIVRVETVYVRDRWFVVHLGEYDDSRLQQPFTLTSVVERLHGTSLEDPEVTVAS